LIRAPLLALLLTGCAVASDPQPAPAVVASDSPPAELLTTCPGAVVVPVAPRPPRSVERIAGYAVRLDESLVRSEAARRECSRRLARLQAWIAGER
jgi:hypothetical protein